MRCGSEMNNQFDRAGERSSRKVVYEAEVFVNIGFGFGLPNGSEGAVGPGCLSVSHESVALPHCLGFSLSIECTIQ